MSAEDNLAAPPHAPETGWARRLLGDFHVTGVFWFKIHAIGIRYLPEIGIQFVVRFFSFCFFFALRRIRRAIASNLEAVLGPCGWVERQLRIFRTMYAFAWCATERYEHLAGKPAPTVEEADPERWQAICGDERGFIMTTAHIGHWESGSMQAPGKGQRVVHVLREQEMDPKAQEFIADLIGGATNDGYRVHFVGSDPSIGPRMLAALRAGEVVAVQGDRPRAIGATVATTLFDRPFELPAGPFALARAAQVRIVPIYVFRTGRLTARIHIRQPIMVSSDGPSRVAIKAAAGELAKHLEWAIRQAPNQWFCFRQLWSAS